MRPAHGTRHLENFQSLRYEKEKKKAIGIYISGREPYSPQLACSGQGVSQSSLLRAFVLFPLL